MKETRTSDRDQLRELVVILRDDTRAKDETKERPLDALWSWVFELLEVKTEVKRMPEVPPLTPEDLGIPTPETNREHIKRLSTQIESIIDGMANLRTHSTDLEPSITKEDK